MEATDWAQVFATVVAGAALAAGLYQVFIESRRARRRETRATIEERIRFLTNSLTVAAQTIQEIENEVNERRTLVAELKRDVETYNRLKEFNQSQIEAITQVVGEAATGEARRSFLYGVADNVGFFLLGAIVSIIAQLVIK